MFQPEDVFGDDITHEQTYLFKIKGRCFGDDVSDVKIFAMWM